jgi:hypothetical protein
MNLRIRKEKDEEKQEGRGKQLKQISTKWSRLDSKFLIMKMAAARDQEGNNGGEGRRKGSEGKEIMLMKGMEREEIEKRDREVMKKGREEENK